MFSSSFTIKNIFPSIMLLADVMDAIDRLVMASLIRKQDAFLIIYDESK